MKKTDKLLKELTNSVFEKIDNKNDMIDINNIYGVFSKNNNKFIICNEKKFNTTNTPYLSEFFTNTIVSHSEVRYYEDVQPWRKSGKIHLSGSQYLGVAFCVSIRDLLEKYIEDEQINKKYILELYIVINEYLKENPNFVNELFNQEKEKTR